MRLFGFLNFLINIPLMKMPEIGGRSKLKGKYLMVLDNFTSHRAKVTHEKAENWIYA